MAHKKAKSKRRLHFTREPSSKPLEDILASSAAKPARTKSKRALFTPCHKSVRNGGADGNGGGHGSTVRMLPRFEPAHQHA